MEKEVGLQLPIRQSFRILVSLCLGKEKNKGIVGIPTSGGRKKRTRERAVGERNTSKVQRAGTAHCCDG